MPSIATLRLASGLVLLAFVLGHLLNHAAGIVSVRAMNELLWLSIAPWRTLAGTALLIAAAAVHAGIALWMLWHRRSLRLHGWEVAQYALGFVIPALLAQHVLGTRVAGLPTVERDGETWRVGTLGGFGANEVGEAAKAAAGDAADVVVVTGGDGSTFVVAAAQGADANAGDIVDDVTAEFGGGGGGGPPFAQGGGISADPEDVADHVREA